MDIIRSAGVVLFRRIRHAARVEYLLLRAYRNWDFPKGVIEANESPQVTALRELQEETGIASHHVVLPLRAVSYETPPYLSSHQGRRVQKRVRFYIAQLLASAPPVVTSHEHHESRWLPYDAASTLIVPRLRAVLTWAHALCIDLPEP